MQHQLTTDYQLMRGLFNNFEKCDSKRMHSQHESLQEKVDSMFNDVLHHYRSLPWWKSGNLRQVSELLEEYKTVKKELETLKSKSKGGLCPAVEKEMAELLREMCQMVLTSCDHLLTCGSALQSTRQQTAQLHYSVADAVKHAEAVFDQQWSSVSEPHCDPSRYEMGGRCMVLMLCVMTNVISGVRDYSMMRNLFQQYGFDYTIKINPTTAEIADEVRCFRDRINKCRDNISCCLVVWSGHGRFGEVCGCDEEIVKLDAIMSPFGDNECPKLYKKPKVFIIDTCRGGRYDCGVEPDEPAHYALSAEDTEWKDVLVKYVQPTVHDMLAIYATQPAFVAFAESKGSVLIWNVADVLSKATGEEQLYDLLVKVNNKVSKDSFNPKTLKSVKMIPQIESTLRKLLYLNPKKH